MSTKIDQEANKLLRTGGLKGEPLEVVQELENGGLTVRRKNGQEVYIPKVSLDFAKARNRGKD